MSSFCKRNFAFEETFTRSQLAAISMDFRGFHEFSLIFIDFWGFHGISWIFMFSGVESLPVCADALPTECCLQRHLNSIPAGCYFIDFHLFQRFSCLTFFANEMLPQKETLLDPSLLLFHYLSWISEDFMRFMDFHGFQGSGVGMALLLRCCF